MIRHVVVWKLSATDPEEKVRAQMTIQAALAALPALIPEIKALTVGPNVAYPEKNWDIGLVADYDDVAGLETYQEHPEHQKVVAVIAPLVAHRANVDFEI